jgi:hypothetical protein
MGNTQTLLVVNVFALDHTDAKRQSLEVLSHLASETSQVELLDVVCTSYSWEQVTDHYPKLWMFRLIYAITKI